MIVVKIMKYKNKIKKMSNKLHYFITILIIVLAILIIFANFAFSSDIKGENYYNKLYCNEKKGIIEYVLEDGTRVDCLEKRNATEIDSIYDAHLHHWYECIGQSLNSASLSGKNPKCVLIIDKKYKNRYKIKLENMENFLNKNCSGFDFSFDFIDKL